jgi:hypothetical protein
VYERTVQCTDANLSFTCSAVSATTKGVVWCCAASLARSLEVTAGTMSCMLAPWCENTSGRGLSYGSSSSGGAPASVAVHHARSSLSCRCDRCHAA